MIGRARSLAMIASRSVSLMLPQRAISASERPHPSQSLLTGSSVQALMQGEEMPFIEGQGSA